MPGLCAYVGAPYSPAESLFDEMLERMRPYSWFRTAREFRPDQGAALGAVVLDSMPGPDVAQSDDGRFTLVLDGELYDHPKETARVLLEGYVAQGAAFLGTLNGMFNAVIWDRNTRRLAVITDRFGMKPIYVLAVPQGLVAASEIKALTGIPSFARRLSPEGLAEFFAFGHFLTDRTFFEVVRSVPPATLLVFDAGTGAISEQTYWSQPRVTATLNGEAAADKLGEALAAAVRRRARPTERLGLSLSGGLDARTLLGLMPPDLNLTSVSIGIEGSIDHRGAAELARLAGISHQQQMLDRSFLDRFESHLLEMVRLTDGHYLDQGIVMPTLPAYRALGIEFLLRGHGGELMHMNKAYSFSLAATALRLTERELEPWLYRRLTHYMLDGVPGDLFALDIAGASRASLHRALDGLASGTTPADRVWPLFVHGRLHRETAASMHMFGCFSAIRMPYIDNDVIDTLALIPAAAKMGDHLQATMLRRWRPAFLDVVNSNTGARMRAGRLETELAHFRMRVGAKLGLRGYQPYERLGLWLRQQLRPLVEKLLLGDQFLARGVCQPDAVRRVVQEHMDRRANRTYLLMSLMIFEMGQQMLEQQVSTPAQARG